MKHIEAVKVIQEIYDADQGISKEYNVYAPGQKKYRPPNIAAKKRTDAAAKEKSQATSDKSASAGRQKSSLSFTALIWRILAITVFSTIVGSLFTWFVFMSTADTTITKNAQINIMIITFLVTFVMSAIPMAIMFLNSKKE
ncbi:MAG TPA: hypothetical protein ENI69_03805 [Rhodospirillales bacterium]|nr:hypothetical protein [Rhodospirillales bacterium]